MLKHKDHFHGSDLEKIEEIYGIRKEDITSFSANVNPLGISPKMREALITHIDAITSYPDREYAALRARIGEYARRSRPERSRGKRLHRAYLFVHPDGASQKGPDPGAHLLGV